MHPAAAGLDVGGTKILGVVVDAQGRVLAEHRASTPPGGAGLVAALAAAVDALAGGPGAAPGAVGVGLPGLVDRDGVLHASPHAGGAAGLPVASLLAAATGLPVVADNDATCALVAEHELGALAGADDALLVTIGTGIGAGLLLDGRVVRGANGFAGEAGHMVVEAGGQACPCGRSGCWERYASGSALDRLAADAVAAGRGALLVELAGGDPLAVRGEHATAAAVAGDPDALLLVGVLAEWIALGLAGLVHLLDVERIVLAGGVAEAGEVLLGPVRAGLDERIYAKDRRPPVTVAAAALGARAGAVGAARLAARLPPD